MPLIGAVMADKRFYWFKLSGEFFNSTEVSFLEQFNPQYVLVYQRLIIESLPDCGVLKYRHMGNSLAQELSSKMKIPEPILSPVIELLIKWGLLKEEAPDEWLLTKVDELIGSECESARRVRKHREQQKEAIKNGDVTSLLQSNNQRYNVTENKQSALHCNRDIDIYTDTDSDTHIVVVEPNDYYGVCKYINISDNDLKLLERECGDYAKPYIYKIFKRKREHPEERYDATTTILKWYREDVANGRLPKLPVNNDGGSFDTDDFFALAVKRSYGE